jgi:methionyl-tRNA formyltransferase
VTRIVFLGTPSFAVPSLEALAHHPSFQVVGIVTQPDRPAGRGRELVAPPVKQRAETLGIPVFQPEKLRDPEAVEYLRAWSPDMLVVAAFGQILRQPVLELARHGSINVHASLLPRWRGAAPIQYAIHAGDAETGITIMKMDAGLDTGPILVQRALPIAPDETGASLSEKLATLGAEILPSVLISYINGEIVPRAQPQEGVTYAPTLKKEQGQIDWSQPAGTIDRHVRAYYPWPGTFTSLQGEVFKVISGKVLPDEEPVALPSTLVSYGNGLAVQTGAGLYRLDLVQPAGKKQMTSQAFLAGHPQFVGTLFQPF